MGTPVTEVYDLFMMAVSDYRLINLFDTSESDFENYLEAFLTYAISDFSICDQSLDFDDFTKEFPEVLTRDNKVMLSTLMTKYWFQKLVNDVTQIQLHITDRDFKVASEAQNLREKANALNILKEQCSQMLQEYAYKRANWTEWYGQSFAGS